MAEVSRRCVLQMPLGGTLEQPGQWAPREFRAVFLRQVLLDQQPDVGERRERVIHTPGPIAQFGSNRAWILEPSATGL